MSNKLDKIEANPEICSGKPVIRGTRIMVRNILSMLRAGYSFERILQSYPDLKREDIEAAIDYAAELVDDVRLISRGG
jgi:uncharacterized protein (DUF433 family)